RVSLIVADLLVLCVTWHHTYGTVKMFRHVASQDKRSLASTLLRDGTIYFVTLLILNVLHVIFTVTSFPHLMQVAQVAEDSFGAASVLVQFLEPLTAVLTWRLLINLQEVKQGFGGSSHSVTQVSDVLFQPRTEGNVETFIGSLGVQISFLGDGSEDGDTYES
ncbi:hypothetical protein BD311DRAFT_668258, partial [Dichomitus squalens]